MQDLSKEAILRMVGLHDAAHIMRQINAIQLSLEEQDEQMVAYWTEIRKDEKEVTLLAGRVSANETSIGQLQVTAQQLTASVSSLTTTVNGHTTSIGQLEITANSVSQRVTVIEGDYVKEAEISLMVVKDSNGYISNANIKADNIDFTFTRSTNFISGGQTVMSINSNGDLWIAGEYRGGTITQNITIGTGTKKMVIEPTSTGARLVGRDGTTEVISVGFQNYGNVSPYVNINNGGSESSYAYTQLDYNSIQFGAANNYMFAIKYNSSGRIAIHGNWSSWYKDTELSSINKGDVYVDGNGFLKVKDY
jgi:hypothetical protein